jgi:hypothetical protein
MAAPPVSRSPSRTMPNRAVCRGSVLVKAVATAKVRVREEVDQQAGGDDLREAAEHAPGIVAARRHADALPGRPAEGMKKNSTASGAAKTNRLAVAPHVLRRPLSVFCSALRKFWEKAAARVTGIQSSMKRSRQHTADLSPARDCTGDRGWFQEG